MLFETITELSKKSKWIRIANVCVNKLNKQSLIETREKILCWTGLTIKIKSQQGEHEICLCRTNFDNKIKYKFEQPMLKIMIYLFHLSTNNKIHWFMWICGFLFFHTIYSFPCKQQQYQHRNWNNKHFNCKILGMPTKF